MVTKGSDPRSWGGELRLKPGPCYVCVQFLGWHRDGERWNVWCKSFGVFRDADRGCWRHEREPGSDDGVPVPAESMSAWRLYGRAWRPGDDWTPPY